VAPRPVFLVGCPRSGTTWLQLLLAHHPKVATWHETNLFLTYLGPLRHEWRRESGFEPGRLRAGLRELLAPEEFLALCGRFATSVLERVAARRPGAELVLEKSPGHVLLAGFILEALPDARFLHLVRDPRGTAASLMAAGRSWARRWAPRKAEKAALEWVRMVEHGLRIPGDRCLEVRYEALHRDGPGTLAAVLRWLGLEFEEGFPAGAVEACEIEKLREGRGDPEAPFDTRRQPQGFYRRGEADGWRDELAPYEIRVVEYVAGPLMDRLGYERSRSDSRRIPWRLALRRAHRRLRAALRRKRG